MVLVNGVPPTGFTRVAVIAETADGVRMVYYLDPRQPTHVTVEENWPDYGQPDRRIHVTGGYTGMNIWQGPMPGDPPRAIEPTRLEVTS